ncbi:hypothetical protein NECAME_05361 [Necator americanus]|uniref:Uncharacterized protein n=1 Tax=Necator americanus TaxID=51031 RepID=W2SHL6_NECAM|nr:hypothetical protein NECAME_05361 [Necator americanus]ETN69144.1 hypothetical protein NECAME_05361 [Necator americanus]
MPKLAPEEDLKNFTSEHTAFSGMTRERGFPESEIPRTTIIWALFAMLAGFWEDSAMNNIDEECERLVEHPHDCMRKAESFKISKRRMFLETLELLRQR